MAASLANKPLRSLQHWPEVITQNAIRTHDLLSHFLPSALSPSGFALAAALEYEGSLWLQNAATEWNLQHVRRQYWRWNGSAVLCDQKDKDYSQDDCVLGDVLALIVRPESCLWWRACLGRLFFQGYLRDCARLGLSLFQRDFCDIARFVGCTAIFVDFEVFQRNRSAAYPAVWDSYRRHTSLQCVLAQETVAQNGQAERCVICQL